MERSDFIEQLIPLFLQNGYKMLKMDDIAGAMSISKKSIYKMFPSKADLIKGVNEAMFSFFSDHLKEKEKLAKNSIEFMFLSRDATEEVMSLEQQRDFFAQRKELDQELARETMEVAKNILYQINMFHFKKIEKDNYLNPNVDLDYLSKIFTINYLNNLLRPDYSSYEEFRTTMRTWHYIHLRGAFTEEALDLLEKYITENPHVIQ